MKKLMVGAKAFTATLLFGSDDSQGAIKTLGAASLEAGKNFSLAMLKGTPQQKNAFNDPFNSRARDESLGFVDFTSDGYGYGPEGWGYYQGTHLEHGDETD